MPPTPGTTTTRTSGVGAMPDPEHEFTPHEHRPRDTPHERPLSRDQLDEERWFEEQGEEMAERLDDLEEEIEEVDRHVHDGPDDDEIAGGHHG